jgi:hypothetical protein
VELSRIEAPTPFVRSTRPCGELGLSSLNGLRNFYENHPNMPVLVFAVLVARSVELDDAKWESDFSYTERQPQYGHAFFESPESIALI